MCRTVRVWRGEHRNADGGNADHDESGTDCSTDTNAVTNTDLDPDPDGYQHTHSNTDDYRVFIKHRNIIWYG
jgi:hypothetical protein